MHKKATDGQHDMENQKKEAEQIMSSGKTNTKDNFRETDQKRAPLEDLTKYTDFIMEKTETLLNIDSPTGYTEEAASWVKEMFTQLGFDTKWTNKGGVLVSLGGKDRENGLLLEAHTDTLGGMVAEVKSSGRLRLTNLGGMNPNNAETENVRFMRISRCMKKLVTAGPGMCPRVAPRAFPWIWAAWARG